MPVAAPESLQVGTRVAYEDAANPRREGRIVEVVYPRCPGCGVVSSSPDAEHLDACRFQGREALPQGIVEYRVRFDDADGEPCRCVYPHKCSCKGDEVTSDLRQNGWHQIADLPGNPFDGADIVLSYSRAQALEDGELVALDSIAQEAGFVWPVALTRPLWDYVDATEEEQARLQSTNGRLWDVLSMARFGIAAARRREGGDESSFDFRVLFYNLGRGRAEAGRRTKRLRLAVGPGDQGEPVVTIGFPEDF